MKIILIILLILVTLQTLITFAQNEPEKKYYGIISGYIEYQKPELQNEKITLYFEEYGNYVSNYLEVTYPSNPDENFMFTFIYNPDGGYAFFSESVDGIKITSNEYPLMHNFPKKQALDRIYFAGKDYISFFNSNDLSYDEILVSNMRGFIRLLGGNSETILEMKMKERGFIQKGNSKILDRECLVWEKNIENEEKVIRICIWKGIVLKWKEIIKGKLKFNLVATNIKENEEIPFYKFETPAGMTWEDWPKNEE